MNGNSLRELVEQLPVGGENLFCDLFESRPDAVFAYTLPGFFHTPGAQGGFYQPDLIIGQRRDLFQNFGRTHLAMITRPGVDSMGDVRSPDQTGGPGDQG
jgi:hypothetical protein